MNVTERWMGGCQELSFNIPIYINLILQAYLCKFRYILLFSFTYPICVRILGLWQESPSGNVQIILQIHYE